MDLEGGAFLSKVDFFACFLGESGLFCAHFGKKWTFLRAFYEKVGFFECSSHVRGMFPGKIMIENYAFRDIMI